MNEMGSTMKCNFPSTHLEKEFPSSINSILMFPVSQTRYQLISIKPEWLDLLGQCFSKKHLVLNRQENSFNTFLAEARSFWSSKSKGAVRSGTWVQTNAQGIDYTFEAMASSFQDQPILLVQHITESYKGCNVIGQILHSMQERVTNRENTVGLAYRDEFTGLYSRRGFLFHAEERLLIARCMQQPVTIACIGIERLNFDNNKDDQGIDDQLIPIAAILFKKVFRKDDILGRVGEDVFLAVIPNMNSEQTLFFNARLNQTIEHWNSQHEPDFQVSCSIGFASDDDILKSLAQLVSQADVKMFKNKQSKDFSAMAFSTAG